MKKIIVLINVLITVFLFASCNADILMNNGEIIIPDVGNNSTTSGGESGSGEGIVLTAPTHVDATKAYYSDRINITWDSVRYADYYTIERTEHENETMTGLETWESIPKTINRTSYQDDSYFESGKYYSYRVTAHTFEGVTSPVSDIATGLVLYSPETVSASKGTSETNIVITWDQVPYADTYRIYKSSTDTVSGVASEIIAIVGKSSSSQNSYSYAIDPQREAGVELSFAVQSISELGNAAEISLPQRGYTTIPGSPVQPVCTGMTRGNSTKGITITFQKQEDVDFVITKTSPGAAEVTVLDTSADSDKEKLENISDTEYSFTDTQVISNVEYTYSIIAKNEIGMSPAEIVSAYLLSPVTNLTLTAVNNDTQFGYVLSFKLPVGSDDETREVYYSYEVTEYSKDGNIIGNPVTYSEDEIDSIKTYYEFEEKVTKDAEMKELQRITITVKNSEGQNSSSTGSNKIANIPEPIKTLASTNVKPREGDEANDYGVYPVYISWETESSSNTFNLYRKDNAGAITKTIVKGNSCLDNTTLPLIKYEYWIESRDELGRTYGEEHALNAYGAVTFETYKDMFESLSLKPWDKQKYVPDEYKSWWKNSSVADKVNKGNASDLATQYDALGHADEKDHFHGGTVNYDATQKGAGAIIEFAYVNFGENEHWWINGRYSMNVNASGNGSASSSSSGFDIGGMYPGHIGIGNISVQSKGFVGSYTVRYDYSDSPSEIQEVDV